MEENNEKIYTFELVEVLLVLKEKVVIIILAFFVSLLVGWLGSAFLFASRYEASVNMIVNAKTEVSGNITNDNISLAQNLVDTYAIIIKSNIVLTQVIEELGLEMSYEELYKLTSVEAINNTQVMKITVLNENPDVASAITLKIAKIAPAIVADAVEAGACKIVSQVEVSDKPVSPNNVKNAILVAILGMIVCAAVIILKAIINDYIVDERDIEKKLGISALGIIFEIEEK